MLSDFPFFDSPRFSLPCSVWFWWNHGQGICRWVRPGIEIGRYSVGVTRLMIIFKLEIHRPIVCSPLCCRPVTPSPLHSHVRPLSAEPAEAWSCNFVVCFLVCLSSFKWFCFCGWMHGPAQWCWRHAPCRRPGSLACSSNGEACPVCRPELEINWWKLVFLYKAGQD